MSHLNLINMAIVKGIFSTKLSGKVGQVVYRTRGGVNTVSEKPANVANPRSYAQQGQRAIFKTVSMAYKSLKEICDHSFESVPYGADSMAYFMRKNLSYVQAASNVALNIEVGVKEQPSLVPNAYFISEGSLPAVPVLNENPASDGSYIGFALINKTAEASASMTVRQFHDFLGAQVGDQFTFVVVTPTNESVGALTKQQVFAVNIARLVFDPAKADEILLISGALNYTVLDQEKSQGYTHVNLGDVPYGATGANDGLGFKWNFAPQFNVAKPYCASLILSRKTDGKWLRSTERLRMPADFELDEDYNYVNATNSFTPSKETKYLNNADE